MNSNNVIQFPKQNNNQNRDEVVIEEITRNVEMMKHYHIQETISNLAPLIFNNLEIAGFGISDDEDPEILRDGAFIVEAIRSILCKHYDIYHPFQQIADNIFEPDTEEEGVLRIVEKLNLKLKKSEVVEIV
jgi:imidazole glycerol phosphate synthase subunit HisF